MGTKVTQDTLYIYYEIVISSYIWFFIDLSILNPIPTRLCHVIYCHGDKSYPCLVGIGLTHNIPKQSLFARMWDEVHFRKKLRALKSYITYSAWLSLDRCRWLKIICHPLLTRVRLWVKTFYKFLFLCNCVFTKRLWNIQVTKV